MPSRANGSVPFVLAAAGVVGVIAVAMTLGDSSDNASAAPAPAVVSNNCSQVLAKSADIQLPTIDAAHVHYFAYDANTDAGNMGPSATYRDAADAGRTFVASFSDPSWTALTILSAKPDVDYMSIDPKAVEHQANDYVANPQKELDDINSFCSSVDTVDVENIGGGYATWGMHTGASSAVMPTLFTEHGDQLGQTFVVKMKKNGQVLYFKTRCHFQLSRPDTPPTPTPTHQPTAGRYTPPPPTGTTAPPTKPTPTPSTPPTTTHSTPPTTPPTTHSTPPTTPPTTHSTPPTCEQLYGPGYVWDQATGKCMKDGTTGPSAPSSAPGNTNPPPADPSSSGCADYNPDATCKT